MKDEIKIPDKRKGVLIGHEGSVKRKIEGLTKTQIKILDSIEISGEVLDVLKAKEIIKAIGRGRKTYILPRIQKIRETKYIQFSNTSRTSRFSMTIFQKGSMMLSGQLALETRK